MDEEDLPYKAQYARSGRATCGSCRNTIAKGEFRIAKLVHSDKHKHKEEKWFHKNSFFEKYQATSEKDFGNYQNLKVADQKFITENLSGPSAFNLNDEELNNERESQSNLFHKYRDLCIKKLSKTQINELLEYNNQLPPKRDLPKRDWDISYSQVADMLAFGALKPCTKCHNTQFYFTANGYLCTFKTSSGKCNNLVEEPAKVPCKIPTDLNKFFPNYNEGVKNRMCYFQIIRTGRPGPAEARN